MINLRSKLIQDHVGWLESSIQNEIVETNQHGRCRFGYKYDGELRPEFINYLTENGVEVTKDRLGYTFDWKNLIKGGEEDARW